jgi:hypothetical protein
VTADHRHRRVGHGRAGDHGGWAPQSPVGPAPDRHQVPGRASIRKPPAGRLLAIPSITLPVLRGAQLCRPSPSRPSSSGATSATARRSRGRSASPAWRDSPKRYAVLFGGRAAPTRRCGRSRRPSIASDVDELAEIASRRIQSSAPTRAGECSRGKGIVSAQQGRSSPRRRMQSVNVVVLTVGPLAGRVIVRALGEDLTTIRSGRGHEHRGPAAAAEAPQAPSSLSTGPEPGEVLRFAFALLDLPVEQRTSLREHQLVR